VRVGRIDRRSREVAPRRIHIWGRRNRDAATSHIRPPLGSKPGRNESRLAARVRSKRVHPMGSAPGGSLGRGRSAHPFDLRPTAPPRHGITSPLHPTDRAPPAPMRSRPHEPTPTPAPTPADSDAGPENRTDTESGLTPSPALTSRNEGGKGRIPSQERSRRLLWGWRCTTLRSVGPPESSGGPCGPHGDEPRLDAAVTTPTIRWDPRTIASDSSGWIYKNATPAMDPPSTC
jgi:hypothetical protein